MAGDHSADYGIKILAQRRAADIDPVSSLLNASASPTPLAFCESVEPLVWSTFGLRLDEER
ncbi:hypothetical protein MJ579_27315 [Klebsiella pneumoniae]|nr:hypothetical protein MJ579_27315 [Klebsiella pneumoniae]